VNFNLILKYKLGIIRIISLIFCILNAEQINAQTPISDSLKNQFKEQPVQSVADTTREQINITQTTTADTITSAAADTVAIPKSDIETRIQYTCRDSIRMSMAEQRVYLYGNAKVVYGNRNIEAEYLIINWVLNEVSAYGKTDSLGKVIGRPVFKEGADMYVADSIRYNMKSGKGIIKGIVTRQGDGFIHGGPVKRTPEAIYVKHALYSTCDLPHPHYSINASKLKVIPGDKVVTGPFHMEIMGIPTPLGLPLGFFPVTRRAKSGIIFPNIGETRTRGFFIQNGGYYWAVNDYVGVKFLGDLYANKSYRVAQSTTYLKRYSYSGMINANYSSTKENFVDSISPVKTMNFTWIHNQTANKPSRFSANVNILSSKYYQTTSYNTTNLMTSSFNSSVSWAKTFRNSPFSLNVAVQQNQNVATKTMEVTAPNVGLTMNRVYIFKKKTSAGNKWYEKINISYTGAGKYVFKNTIIRNNLDNTIDTDTLKNLRTILDNGQWDVVNTIPISTTFKLLKYFNLNPSLNGQVYFYDRSFSRSYDAATKRVQTDTSFGFKAAYSWNFSTTLSTRLYGTYQLNNKVMKAIRHTAIPSVSYTYRPDFSDEKYGFYSHYQDSTGKQYRTYNFPIAGAGGGGVQNMMSFNIVNTLEGKVRNRKDTTGTAAFKNIKLIENFSVSGAYNFTADSCQWSPFTANVSTRLLEKLSIVFTSVFDPYQYVSRRSSTTNEITGYTRTAKANANFLSLVSYNLGLNTSLNPKAKGGAIANSNPNYIPGVIQTMGAPYVDFSIPWNLTLGYSLSFNKTLIQKQFTNSLQISGDVKVSDNWKLVFRSGYDFDKQSIIEYTSIQVYRDLHCWQMSLNLIPFGQRQSFMFTLNAKSSLLRDLKINKQNSNNFGTY
jgi:lipopolysaccharide export system protein LptA